ncbi:phosphoserine phosphatase SerB [Helicobacter mustelae]|uniref:Phosphoserine phosphatase n=1 Tax=Helicobacter mustelae (strain ATCC 43772 / CCUG 25715 / CIP 103759 / LMG 18044 / NCTC 12198 / R85-136P) TaxID=679897 RepID=D3UFZ5_HELM1|nr:phosphoserine phosphatase SerB [Helicobacter mustelae]CBG39416.1 putative phosphoserine phosphatase [Helicobacter mustelae 12198]SQH70929.1 phosphoserine phosphatase [Helicobacter mustelae]STP12055.1 phosphoserine phosphatase [Helicobacter mustelae]
MKLAIFDFDSTLMDGETLSILGKEMGLEEKISAITKKAMAGEMDFFESLLLRTKLLQGLDYAQVLEICSSLPLITGAKEIIPALQNLGYVCICFSGGFDIATEPLRQRIGMDATFANTLHHKDGKLSGLVGGSMMFADSKGVMLQKLQQTFGISRQNTLVVGDGANDISMFLHAKTRVAFCAKPVLKPHANIIIDTKDLTQILTHL